MFLFLVLLTGVVACGAMALAYNRSRDTFHPLIFTAPMLIIMYVLLPLKLIYDDALTPFLTYDEMVFVQTAFLFGVSSFCLGCLVGTGSRAKIEALRAGAASITLSDMTRSKINIGAFAFGFIGISSYIFGIYNVGGITAAYGVGYGGGYSDYGYIRDAMALCIPAIILTLATRANQVMSKGQQKLYIFLVMLYSLPYWIQGFLGSRRGPTFLVITAIGMSWYIMRRLRPRFALLAITGVVLGSTLLFLVVNRQSIFLGSEAETSSNLLQYFETNKEGQIVSNEYLFGAGSIIHNTETGNYYYGRRYFAVIFIRPIPRQLWQNKYEDVGVKEIEQNFGVGDEAFAQTLGWVGAVGAAPGIIADMWVEFSWGALAAMFFIGWCYSNTWRLMISGNLYGTVLYVLLASLSLYLVFQTLEAMLVRFLFAAIPTYIVLRWAIGSKQTRTARQSFITSSQSLPLAQNK